MSAPIIVTPWPIASIASDGSGGQNLLTPSPLEIARADDAVIQIVADLGGVRSIDCVLLGFTNAGAGATFALDSGVSAPGQTARVSGHPFAQSRGAPAHRHALWLPPAPFNARYLTVSAVDGAVGQFEAAVLVPGRAFRPTRAHEWGSGRFVGDTGARERLKGGGFGIDPGVATSGWQWTFGDLLDEEVDALYAIARDRRHTGSVLVVEDPDQTLGLNERIHWGMFDRLEAYERRAEGKTRWAFRIEDWA